LPRFRSRLSRRAMYGVVNIRDRVYKCMYKGFCEDWKCDDQSILELPMSLYEKKYLDFLISSMSNSPLTGIAGNCNSTKI
jgi:hypothetical protein